MTTHLVIIEDDAIFRLITIKMVERIGVKSLKLYECEHGEIGINAIEGLTNTKDKVIVLLDINMPVLDGWGFLDSLQQNKNYAIENITVYVVSSSTDNSDMEKATSYGSVRKFLHKPINPSTIKTILDASGIFFFAGTFLI